MGTPGRFFCHLAKGDNFYRQKVTFLGPVVQSFVSLTSSLVVKMLTALVSTISDSQLFLLQMRKLLTFFQQK